MKKLLVCGMCGDPVVFRRMWVVERAVLANDGVVTENGGVRRVRAEGLWCNYCSRWRTQKQTGGDELLVLLASGVLKIGSPAGPPGGSEQFFPAEPTRSQ